LSELHIAQFTYCGMVYGATRQYQAFAFCCSGLETCDVLRGEVDSRPHSTLLGGAGLCFYDLRKQGGPLTFAELGTSQVPLAVLTIIVSH